MSSITFEPLAIPVWEDERGALRVGQPAPDVELPLLESGTVRLSELWRERPVFLVFGSCT